MKQELKANEDAANGQILKSQQVESSITEERKNMIAIVRAEKESKSSSTGRLGCSFAVLREMTRLMMMMY